uniref:Uncharacterized protein n=1 Tax=Caenorhabditis japonica TaxID=281687 RepID=A0A8R1IKE8_CAEJA
MSIYSSICEKWPLTNDMIQC